MGCYGNILADNCYRKKKIKVNHYLQAKKWLHGLKILGEVAPYQSSQCRVSHADIREELRDVFLQREEKKTQNSEKGLLIIAKSKYAVQ